MSFLAPLYALAALAIGLPLLFHLIQRRPQGRVEFSSTMFLQPSPPRLTRRSRLDNLLLLLLRAAALVLLAVGFARPFLRSAVRLDLQAPSRRIVLAVDASASMRRGDLWSQTGRRVEQFLQDLQPSDDVTLFLFDDRVTTLVSFETWRQTPSAQRAALLRNSITSASPSWRATNLGQLLVAASDTLLHAQEEVHESETLPPQIIVVTDLQEGSQLDALPAYEWPSDVQVDIQQVNVSQTSNATASLLADAEEAAGSAEAADELRVRVRNAGDSTRAQFRLQWEEVVTGPSSPSPARVATATPGAGEAGGYDVHVPPGQQRVVRIRRAPMALAKLVLTGDEQPFDNNVFVAARPLEHKSLLFVGPGATSRDELYYYLQHAALDTPSRQVTVTRQGSAQLELTRVSPRETPLTIVAEPLSAVGWRGMQSYLEAGGRLLLVLDAADRWSDVEGLEGLRRMTGRAALTVAEAQVADYAMWSKIDFGHALFRPFADPRFSDFTKIRFWRHRTLEANGELLGRVLAEFDDGSPALIEQAHGRGTLWILTAGWQPKESQLALSTKFMPLLAGMIDPEAGTRPLSRTFVIGDQVPLPVADPMLDSPALPIAGSTGRAGDASGAAGSDPVVPPGANVPDGSLAADESENRESVDLNEGSSAAPGESNSGRVAGEATGRRAARIPLSVRLPGGSEVQLAANANTFDDTSEPGIYELRTGEGSDYFAVNVPLAESQTKPLDRSELEQRGVKLGNQRSMSEIQQQQRQMRDVELESRQKLWRWGILAALLAVALETWLADRRPRPGSVPAPQPS